MKCYDMLKVMYLLVKHVYPNHITESKCLFPLFDMVLFTFLFKPQDRCGAVFPSVFFPTQSDL